MVDVPRFWAFLSYSHADTKFANWLFRALETYRMPSAIVGEPGRDGEKVPRRLQPIFRDRDELSAHADLSEKLKEALKNSRNLVVLCSPSAAQSKWTNQEIIEFKKLHGAEHIFAAIIDGEPGASAVPGREDEECFPPALRFQIDDAGTVTDIPAEPIAADFRAEGDGKKLAKLKLIAGMLDVPLDSLVQRDAARRNKRFAWLAAASAGGMALTTTLAVTAYQARNEAIFQRGEAAGLVEFMLTDLREKLEPVGRLDTLDAVGERALAYYEKQDLEGLSEDELAQRATALNLVGEVRNLEGDLDGALEAFSEAARTTQEQLRRHPDDPQRYFNHSQSSFWVGVIAWQRGDNDTAREYWSDYLSMAEQMVDMEPDRSDWVAELAYAQVNLAILEQEADAHEAAVRRFNVATTQLESIGAHEGQDRDQAYSLAQAYAWKADSLAALSDFDAAVSARDDEAAIYARLLKQDANDFSPLSSLVVSRSQSAYYLMRAGKVEDASRASSQIGADAQRLIAHDRSNTLWKEQVARYWIKASEIALAAGQVDTAAKLADDALGACDELIATDASVGVWKSECRAPALTFGAIAHKRSGNTARASLLSQAFSSEFGPAEREAESEVALAAALLALSDNSAANRALARDLATIPAHSDTFWAEAVQQFVDGGSEATSYPIARIVGL